MSALQHASGANLQFLARELVGPSARQVPGSISAGGARSPCCPGSFLALPWQLVTTSGLCLLRVPRGCGWLASGCPLLFPEGLPQHWSLLVCAGLSQGHSPERGVAIDAVRILLKSLTSRAASGWSCAQNQLGCCGVCPSCLMFTSPFLTSLCGVQLLGDPVVLWQSQCVYILAS